MGTKIQANTFLREYRPIGSHYHENRSLKNNENALSFKSHDSDKMRQTILEHESVFRYQLQELHRLYRRQQELMNEVKTRENNKNESEEEKLYLFSSSKSNTFPNATYNRGFTKMPLVDHASYDRDTKLSLSTVQTPHCNSLYFKRTNQTGDFRITNPTDGIADSLSLSRGEVSTNSCSKFNLVTKDLLKSSITGTNGKQHLYDGYSEGRRYDKPVAFPQSLLLAEPKNELLNPPLEMGTTSVSRRRKKIFGVEIYEENDDLFNHPSNMLGTSDFGGKNEKSKAVEREPVNHFKISEDESLKPAENSNKHSENQENPNGSGLPWFLRNSQVSDDLSKEKKSSYFMNMDSLQNCSQDFFKKAEIANSTFRKDKTELPAKILGFPISDMVQSFKDLNSDHDNISKVHFDLNLSLDDEDATSAPSLPSAIYKIATTEVNLANPSPKEVKITDTYEERDEIAAEAIIAMSSSSSSSSSSSAEAERGNNLEWFAEIIVSSQYSDNMDEFEYMTLKLEDTKEEHYHYKPFVLNNNNNNSRLSDGDKNDNRATLLSKRSRRGRQQRKDFQRDILPGLVKLSRAQVMEDFQTFEELMKGEQGSNWQLLRLSQRRGRKRGCLNTSTSVKTTVSRIEERSLSGWGKKTRRLPRQRCSNAVLSFSTVKC